MIGVGYIVGGKTNKPTDAQEALVKLTGGWTRVALGQINKPVYWNGCVSPPFGDGVYEAYQETFTKQQMSVFLQL